MEVPPLLKIAAAAAVGIAGGYAISDRPAPMSVPLKEITEHEVDARLMAMVQAAFDEPIRTKRIKKIRQIAVGLKPRQFPGFIERVWKERSFTEELRVELLADWAEVDLAGALAFAETLGGNSRGEALSEIVAIWAERDEASVLAWIDSLPKGEWQREAQSAILKFIGKNDLARFFVECQKRKLEWDDLSFRTVWVEWGYNDPQKALEEVMRQPKSQNWPEVFTWIFDIWNQSDPKAAEAWAKQLPPGSKRDNAIICLAFDMVKKNPREAVQLVEAEISEPNRGVFLDAVVYQWAQIDPQGAVRYTLTLLNSDERSNVMAIAVREWLVNDFNAGRRWLSENALSLSPNMLVRLLYFVSRMNPEQAVALLPLLPKGNESAYGHLGREWAENEPAKALSYLNTIPKGPERDRFFRGYIRSLVEFEPVLAAQMVIARSEGRKQSELVHLVATVWAEKDPSTALAWVSRVSEGADLDSVTGDIVRTWAETDSRAAGDYVNGLSAGSVRDTALYEIVSALSGDSPETAVKWASSIGNFRRRERSLLIVVDKWLRHDPETAKVWVEASNQPSEWKESMPKER